ncbi:MAG TPA: sensor histidine kinase [Actinomycetota bacterium]|nr:sensor histidine kinase [Actinomycetota bacterium]
MSDVRRARLPWVLWVFAFAALGATLVLTSLNGSFGEDPFFISIAIAMMLGYDTIGAIVASRDPRNALGWLMMWIGIAFVLAGLVDEYARYAYLTHPGGLPFRLAAAWLSNWEIVLVVAPIPLLLLLFPDGRPPTRAWRFLPPATVASAAAITLGSILNPGILDIDPGVKVPNPTAVPSLEWLAHGALWVGGLGLLAVAIGSIVALVQRFRQAAGEERQQIRWLATVAAVAGGTLVFAIVSGIGLHGDQTRLVNDIAFFLFFLSIGIGVPAAIGIAVLRYRLWDLDVVVKKTIVAAIVVVLITAVALAILALIGGVVVGPLSGSPEATLVAGIAVGVLFWPLRRIARRAADRIVYGKRATPYEVLTEFSDRMAETYSTDDVLPRMAGIVGAGAGAERVGIWLLVGREMRPEASWPAGAAAEEQRPVTEQPEVDPGTFEVRHQGELLGAITVRMPANDPMNPGKEKLIRDLASQAGLVLRNVRLIEELRASRRRLVAAQDAERRRVERNIHDGAQQQLVALAVKLRLVDQVVDRDPAKARELLAQVQAQAGDTLEDLRDLARGIYPPLLADEGLASAIVAQGRKIPLPVEVDPDGVGRYGQDVEAAVYFCVLEALQNVTKYAGATGVRIGLREEDATLTFTVSDDGVGFDRGPTTRGTGLQGMADRLDALGGSLEVLSAPGEGTTVLGRVPVG